MAEKPDARPAKSDAAAGSPDSTRPASDPAPGKDTRELLALIDELEGLLAGSELDEIEVQAGSTGLLLRKPGAVASQVDPGLLAALTSALGGAGAQPDGAVAGRSGPGSEVRQAAEDEPRHHAIVAPLTGIYYASPSPGAGAYVREGGDVNVGQVIGLIEAMKLFNEIKSDVSGRVVRIVAESGKLVKHKQPLIEVEPS